MAMLKNLGFNYYIEDRSGTNYFILKHRSESNTSAGTIDLYNHLEENWADKNNVVEYEDAEYNKLRSERMAGSIDFIGQDILFPAVNTTEDGLTGQDVISFDINDVRQLMEEKYNELEWTR